MKVSLQGLGPSEKPRGNWADRFGPWILSACLHVIFFCLIFAALTQHEAILKRTMRLDLNKAFPKKPEIALRSRPVPPAPLLPARANSPAPAPQVTPAAPTDVIAQSPAQAAPQPVVAQNPATAPQEATAPPAPAEPPSVTPAAPADNAIQNTNRAVDEAIIAPDNQAARIQRILADYGTRTQATRQVVHGERKDLQGRLETAGLQAAAAPHFPGYSGARVGAIRTLTFDNVSPQIAREVMARYEIRITQNRFMNQKGPSYLNSAASGGSVFTPQNKPGLYDVFEISPKAYQRMIVLEQNWLVSRGYDPRTTFVDTVEFGIVRNGSIFDLGIIKMEVQQLTEIGKPSVGQPSQ